MEHFVDRMLIDEAGASANLNYWAYWIGEATHIHRAGRAEGGACRRARTA